MKIFDIFQSAENAWTVKEILDIPLGNVNITKCAFNPMNKNYIFLIYPNQYYLISLIDSFDSNYELTERSVSTQTLDEFKETE